MRNSGTSADAPTPSTASIRCVITRVVLRKPWHVLDAYVSYLTLCRKLKARPVAGLLKTAFLCEGVHTCYSVSIWDGPPHFSAQVPEHIGFVRRLFGQLARDGSGRPKLWSATWQLEGLSTNQSWDDLDLATLVASGRGSPSAQPSQEGEAEWTSTSSHAQ